MAKTKLNDFAGNQTSAVSLEPSQSVHAVINKQKVIRAAFVSVLCVSAGNERVMRNACLHVYL